MHTKIILTIFQVLVCAIFRGTFAKDVYYDFDVRYTCGAPDGVRVCHVLSINDQYPGPTIKANIGDTLHVNVKNNIQTSDVTTVHWHGLFQNGSQFQDGPHMVTQCPIPKGSSQNYVFKIRQAGTYW